MAEILVLESEDVDMMEEDIPLENPQIPEYRIPLRKNRSLLSVQDRISLLFQELSSLDQELDLELSPITSEFSTSALSEINSMAKSAENIVRGQGLEIEGDLGIESTLTKALGKALIGLLPDSENTTYILNTSLPEEVGEEGDRQGSSLIALTNRISKIEESIGIWKPNHGYYNISQALAQVKKRITAINSQNIQNINAHTEELNAEFEIIQEQILSLKNNNVEQKVVDDMYPLVDLCDQVTDVLPEIIERLESIKHVHDEGARFNERVLDIKTKQNEIEEKLKKFEFHDVISEWNTFKEKIEKEFNIIENLINKT